MLYICMIESNGTLRLAHFCRHKGSTSAVVCETRLLVRDEYAENATLGNSDWKLHQS